MSKLPIVIAILSLVAASAFAQQPAAVPVATQQTDTAAVAAPTPPPAAPPGPRKVYYGGTIGLSFGDYFRFSVTPFLGYKVNPLVHVGLKGTYEYIEDNRYAEEFTSSNYGGSVFSRVVPRPSFYFHVEFAEMSYEYLVAEGESERDWVPFLYVGGGVVKRINANASAYVEVLIDVLQDEKSPYEDWTPFVSVGVGVGF